MLVRFKCSFCIAHSHCLHFFTVCRQHSIRSAQNYFSY